MSIRQMLVRRRQRKISEDKKRLKAEYGALFDDIAALLFRADPIGLDFEDNLDEYEPEARTILPRLKTCRSADEALTVVHQEFVRWFDAGTAGPEDHYKHIASEIWDLWQKRMPR